MNGDVVIEGSEVIRREVKIAPWKVGKVASPPPSPGPIPSVENRPPQNGRPPKVFGPVPETKKCGGHHREVPPQDPCSPPTPPAEQIDETPPPPPPPAVDMDDPANCECCKLLLDCQTPVITYVNVSKSDVLYDRTINVYRLTGKPPPVPDEEKPVPHIKRQLDRFEEARFWDLIGLNAKFYGKLQTQPRRVTPARLVFSKCVYRLHNTRHFAVPLDKKVQIKREDVLKQKFEDDKKLIKRNQAYDCPWEECMHSFRDPQDMRIHYMFDHESVKLFCCGERYENYDAFLEHYVNAADTRRHFTWSARECWGCGKRSVDETEFYEHANNCDLQINPFQCPDPLCPMRYDSLTECVDHFYLWHNSAGSIVINDAVYPSRESIDPDLQIIDDGQLCVGYPLRATYYCQLCQINFAAERYYTEHVVDHGERPHLWLIPTILYCLKCRKKNCAFQRERLLELIPKIIRIARDADPTEFGQNPVFAIFKLFLTDEYVAVLKMLEMKLIAERRKLQETGQETPIPEDHPPCDDARLAYILDSLVFLHTVEYKDARPLLPQPIA
ncbi:unnamed protein product [Caenorhabditis sp. 36 PRJEB53466]|nr:unnamed protein product [Caenorhabditis sp. 36 PRJEB53466]